MITSVAACGTCGLVIAQTCTDIDRQKKLAVTQGCSQYHSMDLNGPKDPKALVDFLGLDTNWVSSAPIEPWGETGRPSGWGRPTRSESSSSTATSPWGAEGQATVNQRPKSWKTNQDRSITSCTNRGKTGRRHKDIHESLTRQHIHQWLARSWRQLGAVNKDMACKAIQRAEWSLRHGKSWSSSGASASCNTVAAWMQMHWSQKEPGVSLQQLRDEWSRVSKAALSIRWVLGAQTRTPQCDPIGRSSVCIRQVISAGAPVSVNYGDVDASMPRNEAWRIRFLEQINYKATGGRKPTGEVKLSKYLIESLLSFNTQCTYTLTCASSQQFCLDLSTMYHPLHETFLRFCILVGILNYSCPFRQWPRIPCDVAFAAQFNILVLDSATEKYLH